MGTYNQKLGFITIQLVEFLKTNEINLDCDEDLDIISNYFEKNFRIKLSRAVLKNRTTEISKNLL